ncbi:MAG: hypothetical protein ACREYE_31380 [Gammaproteobacteria bacterium]
MPAEPVGKVNVNEDPRLTWFRRGYCPSHRHAPDGLGVHPQKSCSFLQIKGSHISSFPRKGPCDNQTLLSTLPCPWQLPSALVSSNIIIGFFRFRRTTILIPGIEDPHIVGDR